MGRSGESIVDDSADNSDASVDDEDIADNSEPPRVSRALGEAAALQATMAEVPVMDAGIRYLDDDACDLVDLASLRHDTIMFKSSAVGVVTLLDDLLTNAGKREEVGVGLLPTLFNILLTTRVLTRLICAPRRTCRSTSKSDSGARSWRQSWPSCGRRGGALDPTTWKGRIVVRKGAENKCWGRIIILLFLQ